MTQAHTMIARAADKLPLDFLPPSLALGVPVDPDEELPSEVPLPVLAGTDACGLVVGTTSRLTAAAVGASICIDRVPDIHCS